MYWFLKILGGVAGVLSLFLLTAQALELGVAAPLQTMFDFYASFVEVLFGWAEPYLREAVAHLARLLDWDLKLNEHWKHITIAMLALFGALARLISPADKLSLVELWPLPVGILVAAVASVAPIHAGSSMIGLALVVASLVFLAMGVLTKGKSLLFFLVMASFVAAPIGGLMFLGSVGLVLGIYLVAGSLVLETIVDSYRDGTLLTRRILRTLSSFAAVPFGALAFVALNAGLKSAGI